MEGRVINESLFEKSLIFNTILQILDFTTTLIFTNLRGWVREVNPILRYFSSDWFLLFWKVLYIILPILIFVRLRDSDELDRGWALIFIGFNLYMAYAFANNFSVSVHYLFN